MKKSKFFAGIMFLAAAATIRLAFAQSGLQYAVVTDSSGAVVGLLSPPYTATGDSTNSNFTVSVTTYTVDQLRAMGIPVTSLSSLAPATTTAPTTAKVTVPASSPIAFCSSGNYYNKKTGQCADGKPPYKIVPTNSLSDPAAQMPNVACAAPKVAWYNPAMKKWLCQVPPGFKASLGY